MCTLPPLALFPGFLSPSAIRKGGWGRDPVSLLSAGYLVLLKARKSGFVQRCAWRDCSAHTSAPNSMTPVSMTGTSLSSTCTSRMGLSIWERLAGSRLQGTHRWITCKGDRWQLGLRGRSITRRKRKDGHEVSKQTEIAQSKIPRPKLTKLSLTLGQ